MAECIVMTGGGGGVDCDEATAKKGDVLRGKSFGGADSDELQIGELPDLSAETDVQSQSNGAPVLLCGAVSRGKTNKAEDALLLKYSGKKGCVSPGTHFTADWSGINSALNIAPESILAGKKIGAVDGTATNDATAEESDLPLGKIAYAKGKKIVGTMPVKGAVSAALAAGGSYTIPAGYHNGSGKITAKDLASQTDADASAANLDAGKTAWVDGKKITGKNVVRPSITPALSTYASNPKSGSFYIRIPTGSYNTKTGAGYPEISLSPAQVADIAKQRYGGVAFNGATFDGAVLSGVANHPNWRLKISNFFTDYSGYPMSTGTAFSFYSVMFFKNSVDLTTFGTLRIKTQMDCSASFGTTTGYAHYYMKALLFKVGSNLVIKDGITYSGPVSNTNEFLYTTVHGANLAYKEATKITAQQKMTDINVSNMTGHYVIGFIFDRDAEHVSSDTAKVAIKHVEFI